MDGINMAIYRATSQLIGKKDPFNSAKTNFISLTSYILQSENNTFLLIFMG